MRNYLPNVLNKEIYSFFCVIDLHNLQFASRDAYYAINPLIKNSDAYMIFEELNSCIETKKSRSRSNWLLKLLPLVLANLSPYIPISLIANKMITMRQTWYDSILSWCAIIYAPYPTSCANTYYDQFNNVSAAIWNCKAPPLPLPDSIIRDICTSIGEHLSQLCDEYNKIDRPWLIALSCIAMFTHTYSLAIYKSRRSPQVDLLTDLGIDSSKKLTRLPPVFLHFLQKPVKLGIEQHYFSFFPKIPEQTEETRIDIKHVSVRRPVQGVINDSSLTTPLLENVFN